jgi:hypothetical protein
VDPIPERSRERRGRMETNKASSFAEADAWDLEYWKARTPEQRLEAYMALREDIEKVEAARASPRHQEDARVLREVLRKRLES